MRVRKLDSSGDMTLGHASADFYQDDPDGVAQNVRTRLQLWQGSWFLDTSAGTPWLQEVLGKHSAVDMVIRNRILGTPGVTGITDFESVLDPDTRTLTVSAAITTQYGDATIEEALAA